MMGSMRSNRGAANKSFLVGFSLVIFVVLVVGSWLYARDWLPNPHGEGLVDGYHVYKIYERNFYYDPGHMVWHVGEKVQLTIMNRSNAKPGTKHQWVLGRGLVTQPTGFPQAEPTGFKHSFFNNVKICTTGSGGGCETVHGAFSVGLVPGATFTMRFVVPNKPGKWTYACFFQNGQHFLDGMHGTLKVVSGQSS